MCVIVNLYKKRFRENKSNISFRAGCVSDGIKNKHLPRKEDKAEAEAEEFATD
jgi:hypothetical protein